MPAYDEMKLSDEQVELLRKAIVDRRTTLIKFFHADKHYSSKNAATNALQSLESKGVLEKESHNKYRITNLPEELHQQWIP